MPAVLKKLGFRPEETSGLITENGTTCIAAVANWLKLCAVSEVTLLTPYYFSTPYNLQRLGISVLELPAVREGTYSIPPNMSLSEGQALWLTNPIFSTGSYLPDSDIHRLIEIADSGAIVVADEALALSPSRIGAVLGGHRNFVGIYTPHKSVCVNGLKFSVITFHPKHQAAFEDWSDVLSGGLSISAAAAVDHFLTPAFDEYRLHFTGLIEATRDWHNSILARWRGDIETDEHARGHFVTAYAPQLSAHLGDNLSFLSHLIEETGCVVIPGTRSAFDTKHGFCFRVNLARDSAEFRYALTALYKLLGEASAISRLRKAPSRSCQYFAPAESRC
jgi:aspartate/methionine/tyrosine aminotransferase